MLHQREGAGLGRVEGTPHVSRRLGKFWLSPHERGIWRVVHGTRHEKVRTLSWYLGHPLTLPGRFCFFQPGSW